MPTTARALNLVLFYHSFFFIKTKKQSKKNPPKIHTTEYLYIQYEVSTASRVDFDLRTAIVYMSCHVMFKPPENMTDEFKTYIAPLSPDFGFWILDFGLLVKESRIPHIIFVTRGAGTVLLLGTRDNKSSKTSR